MALDDYNMRPEVMPDAFDEMNLGGGGSREGYEILKRWLEETPPELLAHRRAEAELLFRRIGITFAVYGDADAEERIIPFDIIPRILTRTDGPASRAGSSSGSRRSTPSSPMSTATARSSGPASCRRTSSTATPTSGPRWRG